MSRKAASRQFIHLVNLPDFDEREWFRRAYSTMQRTKRPALSERKKQVIQQYLFKRLAKLGCIRRSTKDFDHWINVTIRDLKRLGSFTVGQAQKIINILLKYHYSYYWSEHNPDWNNLRRWIRSFSAYFHCPIDRVVLCSLYCKHFNLFQDIISQSKQLLPNGSPVPWSKLNSIPVYMRFQKNCRKVVPRFRYKDLLHYEMAQLWRM